MKRLTIIAAALAACALSLPAAAVGNIANIVVHDRAQNRALPVYKHEGRYYVIGKPGNEYEIRMRNRQRGDILTVVSVDGVDVMSGETAGWDQGGYVLGGYQGFHIKGWRKSLDRVAAFYFTSLPDSYAARTGRPGNVGVIGVAVFRKQPEPVVQYSPPQPARAAEADASPPASKMAESSNTGPASSPALARDDLAGLGAGAGSRAESQTTVQKSARLGTGHGRSEVSQVTFTEFERATNAPAEVITIYYDSYSNLVAQGVIHAPSIARPDPFPLRFAPDPR